MYYVKVWGLLVVLLAVSVTGPMLGIGWLTLLTAFGVAIVKAFVVASRFMHLNTEKRYVTFMFLGMLAFMAMFFFGTSPDVLKHDGQRWSNEAAKAAETRAINKKLAPAGDHGAHH